MNVSITTNPEFWARAQVAPGAIRRNVALRLAPRGSGGRNWAWQGYPLLRCTRARSDSNRLKLAACVVTHSTPEYIWQAVHSQQDDDDD